MAVGIIGYGAHIPRRRIKVEEIAKVWGADAPSYKKGLELQQKSVPGLDEDTITLSVEAARSALARAGIETYLNCDLRPVFDRNLGPMSVSVEPVA